MEPLATSDERKCLVVNFLRILSSDMLVETDETKKDLIQIARVTIDAAYEITPGEYHTGFFVDLIAYAVRVAQSHAKVAKKYNKLGNSAIKKLNYLKAFMEYSKALKYNPNNPAYWCNRAEAFHNLGCLINSADDCRRAVLICPTYSRAYNRLGILNIGFQNVDLAEECFRYAVEFDPTNKIYQHHLQLSEEGYFILRNSSKPVKDTTHPIPNKPPPPLPDVSPSVSKSKLREEGPLPCSDSEDDEDDDIDDGNYDDKDFYPIGPVVVVD